ncbi:MAG: hypothetical protein OXC68_09055 [Aestuariivita sp.]|nr:hypothetical protein [Aestuariivita sp.]
MIDVIGKRVRFVVRSSPSHALRAMPDYLHDIVFATLIDDAACDSDGLLNTFAERGAATVIPLKTN